MTYLEAAEFLKAHDGYLILTHKRPDGDTIGCAGALCRTLRALGKTAYVLPALDATALLGSYLEGCTAPEGFVPETVVSVDVASLGLLPPNAEQYKGRVALAIDHHPSNEGFARETCLEADKAACGEIVWKICKELGGPDDKAAALLYLAVSTDCGCFVYSNTTANTHRVAADLMDRGIPYRALNKKHFRTKSLKRLKLESLLTQRMEFYHGGTVAVAPITLELLDSIGATSEDTDDIAAFAGQVEGVRHSVTIREHEGGEYRISLRTDANLLNASRVCARLGGGGHAAASGCTVRGSLDEAKAAILAAIDAELAEQAHG